VGAGATGTRGAPRAVVSREVGAGAVGTCGAPGAAPSREVSAGATGTRGAPEATPSREVDAGAAGHVAPRELSYAGRRVLECNTWCYCTSYSTSTIFIQWWLQYKPNSMKMVFSTNGVRSF
jgi:hypothetical protein